MLLEQGTDAAGSAAEPAPLIQVCGGNKGQQDMVAEQHGESPEGPAALHSHCLLDHKAVQ